MTPLCLSPARQLGAGLDSADPESEHFDGSVNDAFIAVFGLSPARRSEFASGAGVSLPSSRRSVLKRRRVLHDESSADDGFGEALSLSLRVQSQAQLLLDSLGHVRSPAGDVGPLHAKEVGGAGWCFFKAFFDQLGSDAVRNSRILAAFALVETARRREEFAPTVAGEEETAGSPFEFGEALEVQEGRRSLRRAWRGYAGVADWLSPFAVRVLDKFEGVLSGDLSDPRRYAEQQEMLALVQVCGLEVLIVEGGDTPGSPLRTKLYPSEGNLDVALPKLRGGVLDMVFVHYDTDTWQHYRSVCFAGARPWMVSEAVRRRVETLIASCSICGAILRGERDTARTLMLSLLDPLDLT